jgi:hypothetical protein
MHSYETFIQLSMTMKKENHPLPDSVIDQLNQVRKILQIPIIEKIKTTVIVKKESTVSEILKILNKITEKNYDKLRDSLCVLVTAIENVEDLNKITNVIFNIASSNLFYSKLFSKLYKELIDKNRSFYDVFQVHYHKYFTELQSFDFTQTTDYDKFCEYTKKINQMDSALTFFINLMKTNNCDIENITDLCLLLEDKLLEDKEFDKIEQNEQILHCIYIIIKECIEYLLFHENLEPIVRKVKEIKLHPKLTPKMKFKCMDLDDIIKSHLVI